MTVQESMEQRIRRAGNYTGQDDAVTLAANILQQHLWGSPSVSLFFGPTGCGKTLLWRCLQRVAGPYAVVFIEAKDLCSSQDLAERFRSIPEDMRDHCILVVDGAERLVRSPPASAVAARICGGGLLTFPGRNGHLSFEVDCSSMSVALLVTSTGLQVPRRSRAEPLTTRALVQAGMSRELMDTVTHLLWMHALPVRQLALIGRNEVDRLARVWHRQITIAPQALLAVGRFASQNRLGGLWVVNYIRMILEEQRARHPDARSYHMEFRDLNEDIRFQSPPDPTVIPARARDLPWEVPPKREAPPGYPDAPDEPFSAG